MTYSCKDIQTYPSEFLYSYFICDCVCVCVCLSFMLVYVSNPKFFDNDEEEELGPEKV